MKQPTIGELRFHAAQAGDSAAMSRAIILVVGQLGEDVVLTWGQWLQIAVRYHYDNLPAVDVLMAAGCDKVIENHAELLARLPEPQEMGDSVEIPQLNVGIADNTWWTWTGANAFYHALSGDKIRHLGFPAMTVQSLDVTVLWYRCRAELQRFREPDAEPAESTDAATSSSAGTPAG